MSTRKKQMSVERESKEFVEIDVLLDGVVLLDDVQFSVVPTFARPTVWVAAVMSNGRTAVLIDGTVLGKGRYHVYAKYAPTGGPESPVIEAIQVNVV